MNVGAEGQGDGNENRRPEKLHEENNQTAENTRRRGKE